jgi:long-chain acyl-CoA synthetase
MPARSSAACSTTSWRWPSAAVPTSSTQAGCVASDRLLYALGNLLIYGPLRNVLGMSRIRVAYTAGAAIGPDLFRFYRSIGVNLKQLYGRPKPAPRSACSPIARSSSTASASRRRASRSRSADNGEVLVRGKLLLKEYYKRPDATAEVIDAEGWFHTGDAGFFDEDGHLKIIDRAKDVGKLANGAMFAPNYIENKLKFFPHIKEAVCFGHDRDMVCAFVNIDMGAVGNWAERRGLPYSGYTDLAAKPEVLELIRECVEQVNADLSHDAMVADSQIHRFLVLHKELDPDDDELTRTRKVRRNFVAEKYAVLIDALYSRQDLAVHRNPGQVRGWPAGKVSADPEDLRSQDLSRSMKKGSLR